MPYSKPTYVVQGVYDSEVLFLYYVVHSESTTSSRMKKSNHSFPKPTFWDYNLGRIAGFARYCRYLGDMACGTSFQFWAPMVPAIPINLNATNDASIFLMFNTMYKVSFIVSGLSYLYYIIV
jgi:hypothetical protein